jgi:hypothetical protein
MCAEQFLADEAIVDFFHHKNRWHRRRPFCHVYDVVSTQQSALLVARVSRLVAVEAGEDEDPMWLCDEPPPPSSSSSSSSSSAAAAAAAAQVFALPSFPWTSPAAAAVGDDSDAAIDAATATCVVEFLFQEAPQDVVHCVLKMM